MDPKVIAGIIIASGTIIAAIIAGIFALSKKRKDGDVQKAEAGGNVIQSSGQSSQDVSIIEHHHYPQEMVKTDKLLQVVDEIQQFANQVLVENEEILHPIFIDPTNRMKIQKSMQRLFNVQHGRAKIGEWKSFIDDAKNEETYHEIRLAIGELTGLLDQLHDTLYSDSKSVNGANQVYRRLKYFVTASFVNQKTGIMELQEICKIYLDYLRDLVERIGNVKGELRSNLS